jgi:hypothetical protein
MIAMKTITRPDMLSPQAAIRNLCAFGGVERFRLFAYSMLTNLFE